MDGAFVAHVFLQVSHGLPPQPMNRKIEFSINGSG
jgi:hypothetical protein